MQHEKLNTVEKRLAIYRELREGFGNSISAQYIGGVCIAMLEVFAIDIYGDALFELNFPELYQYRTNYSGCYYWQTHKQRLAAIDKAIADCENKLKNK